MDNLGCMATSTRPRPHKFKEEGYSGYAAEQRQIARQAGQTVDENYIGPARTHFAARQGRKRIAGYSAVRQGGRDEARARAEERKQGAFTRLNEARSRSFGGLKEMDTMKSNPNFARAKTPALDDHFKGQRPVSSVKPKPTNATPAAPGARGPLPGFFDPLKNRSGGQVVADQVEDALRKPQSKAPSPAPAPPIAQQPPAKPSQPPPTPAPKPVATSKPESRQPSAPVQKPIASAKQPAAEQPKMPPLGIGGKIAIKAGDIIAETARGAKVMLGGKDPGDIRPSYQLGLDEREKTWNGIYKPGKAKPYDFFERNPRFR